MIKIALCDDETEYLDLVEQCIHERLLQAGVEHVFERFDNGEDIINSWDMDDYYAIFLDIDMPKLSGVQAGSRISEHNKNAKIFFVSSHDEMVYEAIHARPVRFIRKRLIEKEMSEALDFLIEEINKESKIMVFNCGKKTYTVKTDRILFIESSAHYIFIVTDDESIKVRGKISDYLDELKKYDFVQIQKGIVVNMKYMERKKRDQVMLQNGRKFTISRSRITDVEKEFMSYLRKGVS